MIDLRYQVISLVAVFLALGIGILLGTTLVERGLISEQKSQIKSLQTTFDEIKDKNRSLNDDLNIYKQYSEQTKPYMLSGRLVNRSYVVLAGKDPDEDAIGAIHEDISAAGGVVPTTITISRSEIYQNEVVADGLANLYGLPPEPAVLQARVFSDLVNQLKGVPDVNWYNTMESLGVLQVRGVVTGPVTGSIILGGIEEKDPEKTDLPLIQAFINGSAPLVGTGSAKTGEEVLERYKQAGIPTVSDVDTVMGSVALVLVLEGRGGSFGRDKSSTRLIPEPTSI
ncbi:MAG: copper transporter [Actinobacteria bacterium]|nr:copper transporter [Actinomycetota bacterium]